MKIEYPDGARALAAFETQGLRLPHISNRDQINKWEQENILEAEAKYFSRKQRSILSETFLLRLHKQMFGTVWNWAGKYRSSDKNIGVPYWDVAVKLRGLCEDTKQRIESSAESSDEIAVHFHHRLVFIHPFVNGNGRHARMAADCRDYSSLMKFVRS